MNVFSNILRECVQSAKEKWRPKPFLGTSHMPSRESGTLTPHRYVPGGYHPVKLGDKFQDWEVVSKLGFGKYSTVWLANDGKFFLSNLHVHTN